MKIDGKIKIIIGLGNPEKKSENTYHNIGHIFIDVLQKNISASKDKIKIIKSDVFMNQSGLLVKQELKKNGLRAENLLVVHDDSDIELGKIKWSLNRGSAGHNGVQDIINQLKTKNFWRLRIGIRPPEQTTKSDGHQSARRLKAETFVLKKIPPINKKVLENIFIKTIKDF